MGGVLAGWIEPIMVSDSWLGSLATDRTTGGSADCYATTGAGIVAPRVMRPMFYFATFAGCFGGLAAIARRLAIGFTNFSYSELLDLLECLLEGDEDDEEDEDEEEPRRRVVAFEFR